MRSFLPAKLAKPRPVPLKILVTYPFSVYEQSFIHDYALNPPLEIPEPSIPVIHDLVCTRLIHSGQFAAAVKLDRQFASPGPHVDQRQKERRQMMDEMLAVMPAIEKHLLEAELSQSSQRRESASLSSSLSGSGLSHSWTTVGNTSINDLSMSWEQIPLPAPRPASYNPLKTPAPKRAKAPSWWRCSFTPRLRSLGTVITQSLSTGGHQSTTTAAPCYFCIYCRQLNPCAIACGFNPPHINQWLPCTSETRARNHIIPAGSKCEPTTKRILQPTTTFR